MTTFKHALTIPATPEHVFAAISNPERLARWWGPAGFSNTFSAFDFKTGGRWSLVMHGPDGANYPNENVFGEIVTNQKVVVEHPMQPVFRLTIELVPSNTGTLITWTQAFESADVARQVEHIVVPANDENLLRLQAEVLR
ncbi:MAG TPA: SRPBCC domain-containing protein [Burkholderiaceae bacterium]|nr:SRPBCC domain-containing protein [Burkholderiaceae bacterium]